MPNETPITLIGYMVSDPERRTFSSGSKLASFRVASTPYHIDKSTGQRQEDETLFINCTAWGSLADHIMGSLSKGMRVIVEGFLASRSYQTQQGEKRTLMEIKVNDIGPSLRFATCSVNKEGYPQQQPPQRQYAGAEQAQDPWAGGADYSYGGDSQVSSQDNPLGIDEDPGF